MNKTKKNILIIGSNSGIAKPLISNIRKKGDYCTTVSRNKEEKLNSETHFNADLRLENEILKLSQNLKRYNFDTFIYFPGIFSSRKIIDTKTVDIFEEMNVNLNAAIVISSAIIPKMIKRGGGKIIYLGSSSSYQGFQMSSVYCASKHGILGFSRSIAEELRAKNIKVSCICPGTVNTEMAKELTIFDKPETFIDKNELANFITELIYNDSNSFWQEEIIIKRRSY